MKTMFIECNMGAAGDMLTAALLELLPDKDDFVKRFNSLGLPGVIMEYENSLKAGISGTHIRIRVHGHEESSIDVEPGHVHSHDHTHSNDHDYEHSHDHNHNHDDSHNQSHDDLHEHTHAHSHEHGSHSHNTLQDIKEIISELDISKKVHEDALGIYELIAEAESKAHNMPVSKIHFHEVGMMDAVADILAVSLLMNELHPDEVIVSPIHVGSGQVKCAHGILPVPVPAVEYILRGVPTYSGDIKGELCTPTGAAILRHFATEFGPKPLMSVDKVGYGMGTKDFPVANIVRVFWGHRQEDKTDQDLNPNRDEVAEIQCNLDDMTGEEIGFACEVFLEAGALDVYTQPIFMKKGRPAHMLTAIVKPDDVERFAHMMLKYTSTFGVRINSLERRVLDRCFKTFSTEDGDVNLKIGNSDDIHKESFEYDDLARIAKIKGIPIRELRKMMKVSIAHCCKKNCNDETS